MKYLANCYVDGTRPALPYVSHNKKQLLKTIREICAGEWRRGVSACYYVDDETGRNVYFARILENGIIQYFTKNYVGKF